jgi:SAM-dependent methyltransferase
VINDTASSGFERGASDYERARPSYPQAVLDALPLHEGAVIVDVAAGTGKLTRQLAASPATVVAIEPVAAMRAIAATFAPTAAGSAERLPLRAGSVDAVTVAQAFHWFDAPVALAEIHRALKPGGTLLMVWNDRDQRVPWVTAMTQVIHAHEPRGVYERDVDWAATVAVHGGFTPVATQTADNVQQGVDVETVVARAVSTSYASAGGPTLIEQVARDVLAVVAGFEEPFDFPYVTQIYTCTRC